MPTIVEIVDEEPPVDLAPVFVTEVKTTPTAPAGKTCKLVSSESTEASDEAEAENIPGEEVVDGLLQSDEPVSEGGEGGEREGIEELQVLKVKKKISQISRYTITSLVLAMTRSRIYDCMPTGV